MDDYFTEQEWRNFNQFVKDFDFKSKELTVQHLSEGLSWHRNRSLIYLNYIDRFNEEEIDLILSFNKEISLTILQAIVLHSNSNRKILLNSLSRINDANLPLREIEIIVNENKEPDPKIKINGKFWKEVALYLEQLNVDVYPFNKKARGFLKGIGSKNYSDLTIKQQKWLNGLIELDGKNSEHERYFVNEHLISQGFKEECEIIKSIWDVT